MTGDTSRHLFTVTMDASDREDFSTYHNFVYSLDDSSIFSSDNDKECGEFRYFNYYIIFNNRTVCSVYRLGGGQMSETAFLLPKGISHNKIGSLNNFSNVWQENVSDY